MYFVCVRLEIRPDKLDAFRELVLDDAVNTRKEPGCLRFDVLRSHDNPALFRLHEVYRDEAAFKAHQQTPHFARWRAGIEALQAAPRLSEKLAAFDLSP